MYPASRDRHTLAVAGVRIENLEVRLVGLVTPPGLRLASLAILGSGIRPSGGEVNADAPLPFRAELTAEDLTAFLSAKGVAGLVEPRVAFEAGRLVFRAKKRVLLLIAIEATCEVVVREERYLDLRLLAASAMGAGVTGMAERMVEGANPIFDVSELPVPARLTRATIGDALVVEGEATPPFSFGGDRDALPAPP